MHPPLFKPHPLCKQEVEDLVRCHEEKPIAKFFNACGDAKIALDICFREEKQLRKKLNQKVSTGLPPAIALKVTEKAAAAGAGAGAGAAEADSK